ncbi:unannotated protein [freshwater metagenome]|uniref:Unannotated protein n=1 Tax=freshwater metagenome TaxID=449393 RepID=A0A6J7H6F4_9ZZZZ|nr:hypothetical protein [Actinomycetota bacterium]MSZ42034.1 hypothetical protein [Actinomycetota bacterium]
MAKTPRSRNWIVKIAALSLGIGSVLTVVPSSAQAADLTPAQIDAGLKKFQTASPRASYFMSMEVAPEVTGAVPLKAGMHRLWDMKTAWKDVNPSKGVFDWSVLDMRVAQSEATGARPMLVLGLTPTWAASDPNAGDARWGLGTASPPKDINDWKNYVQAVVSRYGNRIAGYEVWNEANLQTFWTGSYDQLAELTDTAYDIIKSSNSGALVMMASTTTRLVSPAAKFTTGYLEALGRYGNPFDGYTIHTYPAGDIPFDGISTQRMADIKAWQTAVVKAVGPDSPLLDRLIFDTEVNYGLAGPGARPGTDFTDEQGATLLEQTYRDSATLGIDATFWYLYTAAPFDLLGVQMWSGSPVVNAKWNALRAGTSTTSAPSTQPSTGTGSTVSSTTPAPINLQAGRTGTQLRLTWDMPLETFGSTTKTSYNIEERSKFSSGSWGPWDGFANVLEGQSYTEKAPWLDLSGSIFDFRVQAVINGKASDWSTPARIVVTKNVTPPNNVNAIINSSAVVVTWQGSSLDTDLLEGYRIEGRNVSKKTPWKVLATTSNKVPSKRLTREQVGADEFDTVEFRVSTLSTSGKRSRTSPESPRRQFTNELPTPVNVNATYDSSLGWMTMTWAAPDTAMPGGRNVMGYEFSYQWPGATSWTTFGDPVGSNMGSTSAVFDLVNVPKGVLNVRIRSVGWPGQIYSGYSSPLAVVKR